MNPQQKQRKRIVPQLVTSPTGASKHKIDVLSGPLRVQNLQEESRIAKETLGIGRKLYVNLTPYQKERKQVSWRKLLEEQGIDIFGMKQLDKESKKPLDAYLNAITRAMTLVPDDSDSDLGEDSGVQEEGADGSASASDDEGQDQDDEEGEKREKDGKKRHDEEEIADGTGMETNNEEEGAVPQRRRKKYKNSYDYMDDFIDDSEFIQMVEYADKRRSKQRGFVIYRGKIERDEADGDSGYEYDEETGTRKRKRQKKRDETPKKQQTLYVMSDDVKATIDRIAKMAAEHEARPTQNGESGSKKRKMLPVPVREELIRNENVFKRDIKKFGISATKRMVEQLFESLGAFTSKQNLSLYVTGKMGGKYKDEIIFNVSKLKAIVSSLKPPYENAQTLSESNNPFLKYVPIEMQKKISKQIKAGLQGENLESDKGSVVLKQVVACFPEGTMNIEALLTLMDDIEALEQKAAAEKDADNKKSKEEQNKGVAIIEDLGDELKNLDLKFAIKKAIENGANESEIQSFLENVKDDEYLDVACKLLAVAGQHGLKIRYIGTTGQRYGLYRSELNIKTVASNITKAFKDVDGIVKLKDSPGYYALKMFPNVVGDSVVSTKLATKHENS